MKVRPGAFRTSGGQMSTRMTAMTLAWTPIVTAPTQVIAPRLTLFGKMSAFRLIIRAVLTNLFKGVRSRWKALLFKRSSSKQPRQ